MKGVRYVQHTNMEIVAFRRHGQRMKRAMTPDGNDSWPIGHTTLQLGGSLREYSQKAKGQNRPCDNTDGQSNSLRGCGITDTAPGSLWAVGTAVTWTEVRLSLDRRLTGKGENVRRVSTYMGDKG